MDHIPCHDAIDGGFTMTSLPKEHLTTYLIKHNTFEIEFQKVSKRKTDLVSLAILEKIPK